MTIFIKKHWTRYKRKKARDNNQGFIYGGWGIHPPWYRFANMHTTITFFVNPSKSFKFMFYPPLDEFSKWNPENKLVQSLYSCNLLRFSLWLKHPLNTVTKINTVMWDIINQSCSTSPQQCINICCHNTIHMYTVSDPSFLYISYM